MEARAFAELSGDARMLEIFADPEGDLHASTALSFIGRQGVAHKHDVTPDERKQAKTTNFAIIYGGGAGALLKQAKINGRKLSREEAEDWITALESAYSEAIVWRSAYVEKCVRRDYVVIGKDAEKGVGRIYRWRGSSSTRMTARTQARTRSRRTSRFRGSAPLSQ
jgi:DNA polymerase-1